MPVNFAELALEGGDEAGRKRFEKLVVALAHLKHQAMSVAANPGDWGIDAFIGSLDGVVSVWQAKFFPGPVGESRKGQITDSFKRVCKEADKRGYTIETWTLCISSSFDGPMTTWWQGWVKKQLKETGVVIDLWSETHLEAMLLAPEAERIALDYFPHSMNVGTAAAPVVHPLPEDEAYEEALFIKQLEKAGIFENESAKQQFFNHELLSREVTDKGDPREIETLRTVQAEVHALWEVRFNSIPSDPVTGRKDGLHGRVMEAIFDHHHKSAVRRPPMSVVHRLGSMHGVVEDGAAGWVEQFREIAAGHSV